MYKVTRLRFKLNIHNYLFLLSSNVPHIVSDYGAISLIITLFFQAEVLRNAYRNLCLPYNGFVLNRIKRKKTKVL